MRRSESRPKSLQAALVTLGLVTCGYGVWAFLVPHSFFADVAHFEPYNRHLVHDVGVFQIAVGVSLLIASSTDSALVVAFGGFAVFETLHLASHVIDRHLGGKPAVDIPFFAMQAVVGIWALRASWVRAQRSPARPTSVGS